jgi:hypothetical protein
MRSITPARLRGRTPRALLVAALAAATLPAASQAATVELGSDGTLNYRAGSEQTNTLDVGMDGGAVVMQDLRGLSSRTPLCAQVTSLRVRCGLGIQRMDAQLGDRDDTASIRVPFPVTVDGGPGDDTFVAGLGGPIRSNVAYRGGLHFDQISYAGADRGVVVSPSSFDGRQGFDEEFISGDIEKVSGSFHNDQLIAVGDSATLAGSLGDDVLVGGSSESRMFITTFEMGSRADGADRIFPAGGKAVSTVDYSKRAQPVSVTPGGGGKNDGQAGEGDEIFAAGFLTIQGGQAGDTISTAGSPRLSSGYSLLGNGGVDHVEGGEGGEFIRGGPASDTLLGNGGDDFIDADDGVGDIVGCGTGTADTALLDSRDGSSSCENRRVGVLRLTPKAQRVKAGKIARVKLSWRHPVGWRKLRSVELRLTRGGALVGKITIRTSGKRISADGAVKLDRRATRLSQRGKTLAAHLALRLDDSLAGQTLKAEVEATDRRGARQIERDASTVQVAR